MHKRKYDYILPFGEVCFTATMMERLNLRMFSGPFDWMYGGSFEDRFNIILGKFENYFNKEDFEFKDEGDGYDVYMNKKTHICYNHDFPHGVSFDESYPVVAEKYKKRISRVFNKFKKGNKILLLYIDFPESRRSLEDFEKIQDLFAKLKDIYPGVDFSLYIIKHNEKLGPKEVTSVKLNDNINIAYVYNRRTDPKTPEWHANYDNTTEALKCVGIKHPYINYLNRKCAKYRVALRKKCE